MVEKTKEKSSKVKVEKEKKPATSKKTAVSKKKSSEQTLLKEKITTTTSKVKTRKTATKKIADESALWIETVVHAMQEVKAERVVFLDLKNVNTSSFDSFVICEASSSTQVRSIADKVEEQMYKDFKVDPLHKEGYANAEWILLDYGGLVAHIFQKEARIHYRLEDLWGDAVIKIYEEEK